MKMRRRGERSVTVFPPGGRRVWPQSSSPSRTRAMPQPAPRTESASPRKIQEFSGTRMCTAWPTGKAIVRGSFRRVASQLKRLMTEARIPHQTQAGSAARLDRSTTRRSPGWRSLRRAELEENFRGRAEEDADSQLTPTGLAEPAPGPNRSRLRLEMPGGRTHLQFVGVGKLPENRDRAGSAGGSKDVAEDRIEPSAGVHDVKIERDQLAAEVELGIVVQRAAAVGVQTLAPAPS